MNQIAILFEKLYKPILYVLKELGRMFLNIEGWWIGKTNPTKIHIRWFGIVVFIFVIGVIREIQTENANISNYNRLANMYNISQKKNIDCDNWRFQYLESRISELKEVEKLAIENQKEIKKLKE